MVAVERFLQSNIKSDVNSRLLKDAASLVKSVPYSRIVFRHDVRDRVVLVGAHNHLPFIISSSVLAYVGTGILAYLNHAEIPRIGALTAQLGRGVVA